MNPSEENLVGYVLGALDAQEQRDLQTLIDNDPELEDRLLEIKSSLRPLDHLDTSGHPPGLARRTCEMVANYQADPSLVNSLCPKISADADAAVPESAWRTAQGRLGQLWQPSSWSLADVAVGVACMAILAGILFPTLAYTRHAGRITDCQGNLQKIGNALLRYSDIHDGRFVEIPSAGPLAANGAFAPILKDCGLIEDDQWFACAGANANSRQRHPLRIPTIAVLEQAVGEQRARLQRSMGGHFGYTLGHMTDDRNYVPPRNLGRTNVVLLADSPSLNLPGRRSANHGGHGQNLLFEDGRIEFIKGEFYGEDAIFVNDYNLVAPGCRPDDNVIAPSHLSPRGQPVMEKQPSTK